MPRRSSTAPASSPSRWSPTLNRCWWRRPDGWTHPGCAGLSGSWSRSPTPTAPTGSASAAMRAGGCGVADLAGMVAVGGVLEPEAGQTCWRHWTPGPPHAAGDSRPGGQRTLMPWLRWPAGPGRVAGWPRPVGAAPAAGHGGAGRPAGPPRGRWVGSWPGCDRPLAWCDAHHLHHWVDGGPTDLANLALLCRAIIGRSMRGVGGWSAARRPVHGQPITAKTPRRLIGTRDHPGAFPGTVPGPCMARTTPAAEGPLAAASLGGHE
jgi:hypothetical protein